MKKQNGITTVSVIIGVLVFSFFIIVAWIITALGPKFKNVKNNDIEDINKEEEFIDEIIDNKATIDAAKDFNIL